MEKLKSALSRPAPAVRAPASTGRPGSNDDPFRRLLFGVPTLAQAAAFNASATGGPVQTLAEAARLGLEGRRAEAVARLRALLEPPPAEVRVTLFAWSLLRQLGEPPPEERQAYEVLGVVLEMPIGSSYDTLAGYDDLTARYINHSGASIVWDVKDHPTMGGLVGLFCTSVIPESNRARARASTDLPQSGAFATLLTRAGIFAIPEPGDAVVGAGARLMMALIEATKKPVER